MTKVADMLIERAIIKNTIETTKKVEQRKAGEMAKKMLLKNKPLDEIIEFTDLTEKEIKDIAKKLEK